MVKPNKEHLAILNQGVNSWNDWRKENFDIRPALYYAPLKGANLEGANLEGVDLISANLKEANLSRANLSRANLSQSKLSRANLSGANLSGANLNGANLKETILNGANLSEAVLDEAKSFKQAQIDQETIIGEKWRLFWEIVNEGASGRKLNDVDLSQVDLKWTDLHKVDLSGANLKNTNLSRANLSEANLCEANLENVNLCQSNLSGANLKGANFRKANLNGAVLNETILNDANFSGADLSGVDFRGKNLSGVNLSGANLKGAKFSQSNLQGADLSESNLSQVNLDSADLRGANLSKVDLSGQDLNGINLSGVNLSQVNLKVSKLGGSNLSQPNLKDRDLRGANFSNADLSGQDLSGQDLSGVDFSGANLSKVQALGTNFEGAKFTGVCLEDWNINGDTNLNGIICEYVFRKANQQERCPSSGNFALGEFTKLFQKSLSFIDLIFQGGIDWQAFALLFKKIETQNRYANLAIQSIENKGDGILVIRINISSDVSEEERSQIHGEFIQGYERVHNFLEEHYRAVLSSKDDQIVRQDRYINSLIYSLNQANEKLGEVPKFMVEQPPRISSAERGIALAFAGAVLVTFMVLVLNPRLMSGGTLAIIRFLAAAFAGISGYLFSGNLGLEAKVPLNRTQIRATGAFAAFVLVLFLFFVGVPTSG